MKMALGFKYNESSSSLLEYLPPGRHNREAARKVKITGDKKELSLQFSNIEEVAVALRTTPAHYSVDLGRAILFTGQDQCRVL